MKQFAIKSSSNILDYGFFLKKNIKMKEETIDIFIRTNQKKCKILSNQNSSRPLHQDAFTFTNFNPF